jgi:hypothetical protein
MGRSEWGFPLTSQADLDQILKLITAHNNNPELGETLDIGGILKHDNRLYLYITNGGGRELTSDFFEQNYSGEIYYPFDKPDWWNECKNYVWSAKGPEDKPPGNLFK